MFIATGAVATTATACDKLVALDPCCEPRTFSGYVGMGVYGRERGLIKGLVATSPNPGPSIVGIIVMQNGQHYLFKAHLQPDCRRMTPRSRMMSGLIYGEIAELKKCYMHCEDCCYEVNAEYCCLGFDGPFGGDWFYYNGWLMGVGNWRGNDFWFRAYVGAWTYPGNFCHLLD